ncbi:micrococcal nuclease [Halobacillus dabanensis]|uniref:Micrococcal nuclease n=1 Tax=Halobacillus dabanensis TaxID=240302 RepID=A0A1I3TBM8_HALDA|nr:thermonuclease family protein [Halobacillus dabanensis]SFJ67131.1 micrococcal nuclease [Halobacillus dabanensis]
MESRFRRFFFLFTLLFFFLVGCTTEDRVNEEIETKEQTEEHQETDQQEHEMEKSEAPSEVEASKGDNPTEQEKVRAKVTNVVDGDTIDIQLKGKEERVRLLLVDTPETIHPSKPVQPFGPEASNYAKEVLLDEEVRVEYDGPKRDHYDRILAYIWVDGKNFNQQLLEKGLARYAYVYDPPYTHAEAMSEAESRAKQQDKGIWSIDGYVTDGGFSTEEKEKRDSSYKGDLPFNPDGPDRDCGDFTTQEGAQEFYEAAGGPGVDPHRLDGNDDDGLVCESLP